MEESRETAMATTHARPAPVARTSVRRQPRWLRIAAVIGAAAYCVGISLYLLTHGGWPTPDYLIPPLLLAAVALGRGPAFLADWGPFLLIILGWQASAGIADQLGRPVHMRGPLEAERALFGGIVPTVELQRLLYHPGRSTWYDWLGVFQHAFHFVLPVLVGFWLWLQSRRVYWRYMAAVLVLFFAGFATYALYPAAPPWMAGLAGMIPLVHRIAIETVLRLPPAAPVGLAYTYMSPNPVAAMPSLHAALPMLIALVLIYCKGRWAVLALLYPLLLGFYLVYLGEHYAVDVLVGYAFAVIAFAVVYGLPWARVARALRLPRVVLPRPAPGPAWDALGHALMPALAVASIAVIVFSLRPGRPADERGPIVPGLQVQAGDSDHLEPLPCDAGASPSLAAGGLLLPVAAQYAAFLFDVDDGACYVLTANTQFPPPPVDRIAALADRAPIRLRPLRSLREGVEFFSVYSGYPSEQLQARGFPADHRLVLVAALAGVPNREAATVAVEQLAALAFMPVGPVPPAPAPDEVPSLEDVPPLESQPAVPDDDPPPTWPEAAPEEIPLELPADE